MSIFYKRNFQKGGILTFKEWMIQNDLSIASAKKYESAVYGSISNWAMELGLIDSNLIEIEDQTEFDAFSEEIKKQEIFTERNTVGNNMYSSALNWYGKYLKAKEGEIEEDLEEIFSDDTVTSTQKISLITTRLGQGVFRKNLITHWKGCAVTGYKNPKILLASHIKPWRDSNNNERLDIYNGLLLLPNLDKAFDSGFISFDKKGKILISNILEEPKILGIYNEMKISINDTHQNYMEYHRDIIFHNI
ncbi:MAG: HNH endonuclease [Balneolaceae bacterium]